MTKINRKKVTVILATGLFITLASAAIPRLGVAYTCQSEVAAVSSYNRDERGLPMVFVHRSIQEEGCVATTLNGREISGAGHHRVLILSFVADVVVWSGLLALCAKFVPRIWRKL